MGSKVVFALWRQKPLAVGDGFSLNGLGSATVLVNAKLSRL
jgi:hypothetical protein